MAESNGNSETQFQIPKIKFTKLFINGEFVDSVSGNTFETIDPRNEEVIARISEGDKEDVDLAVKAAREAFDNGPWPRLSPSERRRIMLKFADLIIENAEEIAALDAMDAGKLFAPVKNMDIPAAAEVIRYYAGAADKIHGTTLKMSRELQGYTLLEPIGVVGHIIPWNFPTQMFVLKVGPALAAGCTMIVKPAEQTPLSALYYAQLAKQAGVPDGVINVVTGFGSTAGAALCSHMDVDKISFTGSTEVGRLVMQAAALSNLKPVSLELGGKSPFIVFDDVDVEKIAPLALVGILYNKGEICVAGSRLFIQEGIYDKFVKKLEEMAKTWVVGDPFDPNSHQGPQVDKKQYERVLSYIEHGKREGAKLLTGGNALDRKGYFIEPTIFIDVEIRGYEGHGLGSKASKQLSVGLLFNAIRLDGSLVHRVCHSISLIHDDMTIAKEEIFGPVLAVMKFKTVEEVIKRANCTNYGLAAGVMTNDLNIANTVSRSIRAGVIWINCYFAFDPDCPYGGYKCSGFERDLGMEGLHKYLQVKSVATPIYNSPWL